MIISFGWTWPAFVARAKTATRRAWTHRHASSVMRARGFDAYDRNPMFGGRPIGRAEIVDLYEGNTSRMPDSDYVAEGFAYLHEHPELIPRSARKQSWYPCRMADFEQWRAQGDDLWVVRFTILDVTEEAQFRLDAMLKSVTTRKPVSALVRCRACGKMWAEDAEFVPIRQRDTEPEQEADS